MRSSSFRRWFRVSTPYFYENIPLHFRVAEDSLSLSLPVSWNFEGIVMILLGDGVGANSYFYDKAFHFILWHS